MSKNIVFIVAVKKDGFVKPEYQLSINSWKHFCDKNDCELFLLEEPVLPPEEMNIILQRYFLFDILEANEIEYNQILMVDADTIVHPDCPNFFNETENKYCLVHDDGSYDWVLRGMEHYSEQVYDGYWFDYTKYGNGGFQIVNDKHRDFFKYMRDFYFENADKVNTISQTYGVGVDQTILNFNLNTQNVDTKLLPYKYNMTCMIKKDILTIEDMFFTKVGWVYHFNGIPDKEKNVPFLMKRTYDYLYG